MRFQKTLRLAIPVVAISTAVMVFTVLSPVMAQESQRSKLKFEVVSIKRNVSTQSLGAIRQQVTTQGQRLLATNVPVRELIRYAYGYQFRPLKLVRGGPDWLDSERYDVAALASVPFAAPQRPGALPDDAVGMLQSMLHERMRLQVRTERIEGELFELVTNRTDKKLGSSLTRSRGLCFGSLSPVETATPGQKRCPVIIVQNHDGSSRFELGNVTISDFAQMLGTFPAIGLTVVDKTGLTDRYDVKLRFRGAYAIAPDGRLTPGAVTDSDWPTLMGAVQEQLGLKLNRTKGLIEALVVEQVERPSEN